MRATDGKLVAIDGKTVRRSFAREEGKSALHVVGASATQKQLVLGQLATDQKSNEITAITELLAMLDLSGATITIDAIGCQRKIAESIVDAKADTVLTSARTGPKPGAHRTCIVLPLRQNSHPGPTFVPMKQGVLPRVELAVPLESWAGLG